MKPILPTNYKDDILNTSVEGMRRYQMIYNSDNTVSLKDVTPYDQTGSDFGAGDINLTNQAVNQSADAGKIIDDLDTAEATTEEGYIAGVQLFNHVNDSLGGLQFGIDENGNYGYIKAGADTVTPFKSKPSKTQTITNSVNNTSVVFTFDELEEVVGVVKMTATPTSTYSTTNFYIESISGNTVTVKTYRGNSTAPYSVELTCVGY